MKRAEEDLRSGDERNARDSVVWLKGYLKALDDVETDERRTERQPPTMTTELPETCGSAVVCSVLLAITFQDLFAEARSVQDRTMLLTLAKEHHIRKQNFDEALKYREAEKALKAEVDNAVPFETTEAGRSARAPYLKTA
jgi:predicted DsbA family dithiol-disulfide isomerase